MKFDTRIYVAVFGFEQCCRLFYQMINNSAHLKQSNSFKVFTFNKTVLDEMMMLRYSFYKYSQCEKLVIRFGCKMTYFITDIQHEWERALSDDGHFDHDHSFLRVFKSIRSLELNDYATLILLHKLPLDVLFDPQSRLEHMKIAHDWTGTKLQPLRKTIAEFEQEYLNTNFSHLSRI